ncbi:hypothetical protein QCE62_00185 [Caballeronia sp. LZ033]|uniref:deoxynucleotide monophosphate kinase family protein n=1 Tax=Caballeronia sp. LZ033 TaxID=3038566 RepID=UPI00285CB744|nr:hypothetical protein [Caballeronia sp. LZ033]MDR5812005.1 hypothetical protein [Caballeronia sp. LZ033]
MRLFFPIIGIAGPARSGKDTIGKYLKDEYGYAHLSFAEPLRQFVCQITGIPRERLDDLKENVIDWIGKSPRQMLQTLGTEWGRGMVNENLWVLSAMYQALALAENDGQWSMFTDVRFENEADAIRQRGGIIIHVSRPDALQVAAHVSEAGVPFERNDWRIVNDGTLDDLYTRVNEIMENV